LIKVLLVVIKFGRSEKFWLMWTIL